MKKWKCSLCGFDVTGESCLVCWIKDWKTDSQPVDSKQPHPQTQPMGTWKVNLSTKDMQEVFAFWLKEKYGLDFKAARFNLEYEAHNQYKVASVDVTTSEPPHKQGPYR